MTTRLLLLASLALNLMFTFTTMQMWEWYLNHVPFDMEQVRKEYKSDVLAHYMRGCVDGTDYPPEFRNKSIGWNENSPASWCAPKRDDQEDWIQRSADRLGRRSWQ